MSIDKKVDKSQVEDILRLTPLQEGMLFHYLHEPGSDQYLEQLSLKLVGKVEREVFEKAWYSVINKNEMLRTIFRWEKISHPVQIIMKDKKVPIIYKDLSQLNSEDRIKQIDLIKMEDKINKIDLSSEPFRIILIKKEEDKYEMIITNHHIIYDGWSNSIILKEFMNNYSILYQELQIPEYEKRNFKDFVKWIQSKDKEKQEKYWKNYLSGFDMKSLLPFDYAKLKKESKQIKNLKYTFKKSLIERMEKVKQTYEITFSTLVYVTWGLLLQKYNDSNDVIFGTAVSGRNPDIKGIEEMVGLMINTLPLRIKSTSNQQIYLLLKEINSDLRSREEHESTPLSDMIAYSGLPKEAGLFDSIMVVENYPIDENILRNGELLQIESFDIFEETNFDLSLQILLFDKHIELIIQYNSQTINQETIENLASHFFNILEEIVDFPEKKISDIKFLPKQEYQALSDNFNSQLKDDSGLLLSPDYNTLQYHLFESINKNKHKIALEYLDKKISYSELDMKSTLIAKNLLSNGLKKGTFVGILLNNKLDLIISIIGILKAGCVFVPLDTKYPVERLHTMIDTTDMKYVLVDDEHEFLMTDTLKNKNYNINFMPINKLLSYNNIDNPENLNVSYHEDDPLYIFFTSGSTGVPKAVIGRNGSLLHFVQWEIKHFSLNDSTRVSQFTSPCHNPLLRDIFVPLCAGGTICIPESKEQMLDSNYLIHWVKESKVNLIHCTPSLFKLLSSNLMQNNLFPELKYVLLAGERATPKDLTEWYNVIGERIQLVSLYGQTETTLAKMCYFIQPEDVKKINIPIGKAIDGAQVVILDKDLNFCAVGFKGEIYVRTPFRSLGYYNNTKLNKKNFIINPFSNDPHDIIYKTGDVGKTLSDGNIEFLGRTDRQIKIRGFRIELNEVENTLLIHRLVKEAAVIIKENDKGINYLCAYIVLNLTEQSSININKDIQEINTFLSQKLPDYMIPQYFIPIDFMPMNLNGKLDYKALPEPEQQEYVAPNGEIEEILANIWSEILEIERVGRNDKFLESGGHSLNVMSLIFKVQQQFGVELPLSEVFQNITLKDQANFIVNTQPKTNFNEIKILPKQDYYELSPTQKGMFISYQLNTAHTLYNIPYVAEMNGKIDIKRLEEAFRDLIIRHESLRTSFHYIEGKPYQKIEENYKFDVIYLEIENINIEESIKEFIRPFDLTNAPLFRVKIVQTVNTCYLLFDIHHIVSDGVSMTIIVKDLISLYEGKRLSTLKVQYKEYAHWLQDTVNLNVEQEQYWLKEYSNPIQKLILPIDYPRPASISHEGEVIKYVLNNDLKNRLDNLAKNLGCTNFMIYLTAYILLLHKYTNQKDIVVGIPVAGRNNLEFENIVGAFINLLPLRNQIGSEDDRIQDLLMRVKEKSVKAFMHQNYPFEQLVSKLDIPSDLSKNAIFDTMFAMQNMESIEMEFDEITYKTYELKRNTSKYDLSLLILEQNQDWILEFEYSSKLFKSKTIKHLSENYLAILEQIESIHLKISEVKLNTFESLPVESSFSKDSFSFD